MSFRLWMIFYVFALLAAAMATFGPVGGIVAVALVLGFWAWQFSRRTGRFSWARIIVFLLFGALAALLAPAVQSVREAALRAQCANNLKQISLAILNYEGTKAFLPPAYTVGPNGKPMHSWRVLILPFLGENALYAKYNFNEPWNGPNNSKLIGLIPDVYRCPSHVHDKTNSATETNYLLAVGPETAFPGSTSRTIRAIPDGTSKTITVIESSGIGVNWMEPRDLTLDEAVQLLTTTPRSGHRHISDGLLTTTYYETSERNVARCDGSVRWMAQLSDAQTAKALLTAAGQEIFHEDELAQSYVAPKSTTVIKWGKVWALSVFLVLVLLPMWWAWKHGIERKDVTEADTETGSVVNERAAAVLADATAAI